ncbi:MAG: efflux RND transporter periplasmic adaptor subunit [Armatimonadota bacterium]
MVSPQRPGKARLPRWVWVLITALAAVLAVLGIRAARRPAVVLVPVVRGTAIAAVYAPGTVLSGTETVVAASVAGRLLSLTVQRGDTVRPGQVVAQLDDIDARNAVAAAQADLVTAQAQIPQTQAALETARTRVITARQQVQVQVQQWQVTVEQLNAARARVERARADLASARDNLSRQQYLYAQRAISQRQLTEAQSAVRAAEAGVDEAQANAQAAAQAAQQARAGIAVAQNQVAEAQNGVVQASSAVIQATSAARAAQARLTRAQNQLTNYTVRSQVSGVVSNTPVQVGDYVQIGGAVARVVSTSALYVEAQVDEADIGPVAVGQTAYFTTDTNPNVTYQGQVTEVGASANPATNTYPVEVRRILNSAGLRVQMSVDVNIVTRRNANALLVPSSAVVLEPQPHVWKVDTRAQLTAQPVTLGARDIAGGQVEIRNGLREGDLVVRDPQAQFKEGLRVRVSR